MGGYAWVTLATNDSYSLGALVLAHSLKKCNTAHRLAIMITPAVSQPLREHLHTVFDVIKVVDVLDSKDEAHLALMKRPELGVTFTKIHCWNLLEFDKCVFLDADTLVVRNCDELFEREEFSAAPDVSWPDCFNSGVFVYRPSVETFGKLLQFAIEKGSFDGGDQGLLNQFFGNWATEDIKKHLPFVYNLTSVAVYSYIPAFKHYASETRIVHFIGTGKPWLQQLDPATRTVTPSSGSEHLTPLLQQWWDLFCEKVHPNLEKNLENTNGMLQPETFSNPVVAVKLTEETFTDQILEPYTPYREKDDFRQYNLPYQAFDVKGSSGELLNVEFLLASVVLPSTPEDGLGEQQRLETDNVMEEKTEEVGEDCKGCRESVVSEVQKEEVKEPEPEPQEGISSPKVSCVFDSFFPDETCVKNYLEQNVIVYQPFENPDRQGDEKNVEETSTLPRFLAIPDNDQRQSGNTDRCPSEEPEISHESKQEPTEHPPRAEESLMREEPIVERTDLTKSKSMSSFVFDVTTFRGPPSGVSEWKLKPDKNVDSNRRYLMPKLKPILPKQNSFGELILSIPKVTLYTEFLMSSEYKDPVDWPKDKVGFVETYLRRSKSEADLKGRFGPLPFTFLEAQKLKSPIKLPLSPMDNNTGLYDLTYCKRQLGNKPKVKKESGARKENRKWKEPLPALKSLLPKDKSVTVIKKRKSKESPPRDGEREKIPRISKKTPKATRERKREGRTSSDVDDILKRLKDFSKNYQHYFGSMSVCHVTTPTTTRSLVCVGERDADAKFREVKKSVKENGSLAGQVLPSEKSKKENSQGDKGTRRAEKSEEAQLKCRADGGHQAGCSRSQAHSSDCSARSRDEEKVQYSRSLEKAQTRVILFNGVTVPFESAEKDGLKKVQFLADEKVTSFQSKDCSSSLWEGEGNGQCTSSPEIISASEKTLKNERTSPAPHSVSSLKSENKTSFTEPKQMPPLISSTMATSENGPQILNGGTGRATANGFGKAQIAGTKRNKSDEVLCAPDFETPLNSRTLPTTPQLIAQDILEEIVLQSTSDPARASTRTPTENGFEQPEVSNGWDVPFEVARRSGQGTLQRRSPFVPCDEEPESPAFEDTRSRSGIAGAIAQLNLETESGRGPESSSGGSTTNQEYMRRLNWETGNIDYMGKDSFDNIWSKICQTLEGKELDESTATASDNFQQTQTSDTTKIISRDEDPRQQEPAIPSDPVPLFAIIEKCPEPKDTSLPAQSTPGSVEDYGGRTEGIFPKSKSGEACLTMTTEEVEGVDVKLPDILDATKKEAPEAEVIQVTPEPAEDTNGRTSRSGSLKDEGKQKRGVFSKLLEIVGVAPKGKKEDSKSVFYDDEAPDAAEQPIAVLEQNEEVKGRLPEAREEESSLPVMRSPSPKLKLPQLPDTAITMPTPPPFPDTPPETTNPALLKVDETILETPPVAAISGESVKGMVLSEVDQIIEKAKSEVENRLQDRRSAEKQTEGGDEEVAALINTMKLIAGEGQEEPPKATETTEEVEELKVTPEEERRRHKGEAGSSKLSDQILKAIPPPRRKAISESKAEASTSEEKPPGKPSRPSAIPVPPPRNRSKPTQAGPPKGKTKK